MCVCPCVCICVRACVRVCVRERMRVSVFRVGLDTYVCRSDNAFIIIAI